MPQNSDCQLEMRNRASTDKKHPSAGCREWVAIIKNIMLIMSKVRSVLVRLRLSMQSVSFNWSSLNFPNILDVETFPAKHWFWQAQITIIVRCAHICVVSKLQSATRMQFLMSNQHRMPFILRASAKSMAMGSRRNRIPAKRQMI